MPIVIFAVFALLIAFAGGAKVYNMTRGIRNNNPLNIRRSKDKWKGLSQIQSDPLFFTFDRPEDGIRAGTVILRNYRVEHSIDTLEKIIARWAPPEENDTAAYIDSVSRSTGIPIGQSISDSDFPAVIAAMIKQENGVNPYDFATIQTGVSMA